MGLSQLSNPYIHSVVQNKLDSAKCALRAHTLHYPEASHPKFRNVEGPGTISQHRQCAVEATRFYGQQIGAWNPAL